MTKHSKITDILAKLPEAPGVYRMKNAKDSIIYVGKSVNLRSRVRSYFMDWATLNAAKIKMVSEICDIDWIETRSEVEALVLETNLIKEISPKYNVLMKDDKDLAYIRIESWVVSDISKTRQKRSDGSEYFGPFPSGARITSTLKNLKRIFQIRSCAMKFGESAGKPIITAKAGLTPPCMDYYIGICPGPCLLGEPHLKKHAENTESLKGFLKGNTSEVVASIEERMREHAKKLEFEEAKKLKDQLDSIKFLSERQIARNMVEGDVDGFFLLEKYDKFFAGYAIIRDGELRGIHRSLVANPLGLEKIELAAEVLSQRYGDMSTDAPKILLLSGSDGNFSDSGLSETLKERKIRIEYPEIGAKAELLTFLKTNLLNFAYQGEMENLTKRTLSRGTMKSILEAIGYEVPTKWPISFECYDISHTDGHFTVASRVVIEDGKPKNSAYKKYKIKTLEDGMIDDFASMREVLERRTREGLELGNFPTMILIDGGKWQLSAAKEAMERVYEEYAEKNSSSGITFSGVVSQESLAHELVTSSGITFSGVSCFADTPSKELQSTPTPDDNLSKEFQSTPTPDDNLSKELPPLPYLASLAKREEEIFVPWKSESHLFAKDSSELAILQTVRDEAHRFAIGFNRAKRTKEMKKNILEELPGFGPTTRKKLLKIAGSLSGVKELSEQELTSVLTKTQVETLRNHGLIS